MDTKIKKSILESILMIGIVAAMMTAGTQSYFSDTETSGGNTFTAGTLNLQVGDDDPCTIHITIDNIAPGWSKSWLWKLENTGSLDGNLTVEFSEIINNDNGLTEPESAVDTTGGDDEGELGQYLIVKKFDMRSGPGTSPWTLTDINDNTFVCDYGFTLNEYGGRTFSTYWPYDGCGYCTLESGETQYCFLQLELPSDVGNIVQSDSVEFDITFSLEQVRSR